MTREEREQLIADVQRRVDEALRTRLDQVGERQLTIDEIEQLVEDVGMEVDSRLEQGLLEKHGDPAGNTVPCPDCDQSCRFKDTHETKLLTTHGERTLACRYYYCPSCRRGFYPAHAALGIERGRRATRRVRAWQAKYGSESAFAAIPELFRELRGIEISASTVERTTIEVGRAVEAAAQDWEPGPPERKGEVVKDRLYLSMDGTMTPLRNEWRRDGTLGKLVCRYGEAKLGVLFQTLRKNGQDTEVARRGVVGTLGDVGVFREKVAKLATQWRVGNGMEHIVLGDGSVWIWNTATEQFPDAVQILDYWHVTEHLGKVAQAMHGKDAEAARKWVAEQQSMLKLDMVTSFLIDLREWKPKGVEAEEVKRVELAFFETNQERIRYGTYLKKGYMIGSGVMESACRQVSGHRLDQAGMHWRQDVADAVLAIRAHNRSTGAPHLAAYA